MDCRWVFHPGHPRWGPNAGVNPPKLPPNLKVNKYKEKFYELRTKYENVSNMNTQRQRELAESNAKLRKLQDECAVLLDTIGLKGASEPTLAPYLQRGRTPPPEPLFHAYQQAPTDPPYSYHTVHGDYTSPQGSHTLAPQASSNPFSPRYAGTDSLQPNANEIDPRDLVGHSY